MSSNLQIQANSGNEELRYSQEKLKRLLGSLLPEDGNLQVSQRLSAFRRSECTGLFHGESSLAFCMIAQGAKEVYLGDDVYIYDQDHYLITAIQLPTVSHIIEASPEEPYLSIKLELDSALVSSVLLASAERALAADESAAFNVASTDADLIDAVIRLLKTSRDPDEAQFLTPQIEREIIFRLLRGNEGGRLRHIAGMGPASQKITFALNKLRAGFHEPLHIPAIAEDAGMSVSSFHDHFKRVTGLSPLQFQKQLRLREARRILLSEDIDVANAGFRVGYNDASHFNRDYRKLFGQSPTKDIETLRAAGPLAVAAN